MSNAQTPTTIPASFVEHKYILVCWLVGRCRREDLGPVDKALGIISALRLGAGWMVRHLLEGITEDGGDDIVRLGVALQLNDDPAAEAETMLSQLLTAGPVPDALMKRLSYYLAQSLNTASSPSESVMPLLKLCAECDQPIPERDLARREIEICGQDIGWSTDVLNESSTVVNMVSDLLDRSAYSDVLLFEALTRAASPEHIPADDRDLLSIRVSRAEALRRSGQLSEAHGANADLLRDLEQMGRSSDEIYRVVLNNQAHASQALGNHSEARKLGQDLVDAELAQDPRDEFALAIAENFLGMCETRLGEGHKAAERFKTSLGYWHSADKADHYGCGLAHHNLAGALQSVGDLSGAIKHAEEALGILENANGADSDHAKDARSALAFFRNMQHRQLNGEHNADLAPPAIPSSVNELCQGRADNDPGYVSELIDVLDRATVQNDVPTIEIFAPEARRLLDMPDDILGEREAVLLQLLLHSDVLMLKKHAAREIADRIETKLSTNQMAPAQHLNAARSIGVFHAVFGDPSIAATHLMDACERMVSGNLKGHLITSMPHVRAGVIRSTVNLIGLLNRVLIDLGADAPGALKLRLLRIVLSQQIQERITFLLRAGSTVPLMGSHGPDEVLELRDVNEGLRRATLFHPGDALGQIPGTDAVASLQSRRSELLKSLLTPDMQSHVASLHEADPIEAMRKRVGSGHFLMPLSFTRSDGEDRHNLAEYQQLALSGSDDVLHKLFSKAQSGWLVAKVDEGSIELDLIDAGSRWELGDAALAVTAFLENSARGQRVPSAQSSQDAPILGSGDAEYIKERAHALHRSNAIVSTEAANRRADTFPDEEAARHKLVGTLLERINIAKATRIFVVQGGPLSIASFDALLAPLNDTLPEIAYYSPAQAALTNYHRDGQAFRTLTAFVDPDFDHVDPQTPLSPEILKRMAMSISIGGGSEAQIVYWEALPGTAKEADAITKILPADVRSGSAATKASLIAGKPPSILHLATHGHVFGEDDAASRDIGMLPFGEHPGMEQAGMMYGPISDPYLRVGLALAGANWRWHLFRPGEGCDDGFLTASEILRLDLKETSLVVLSACETAHGEVLAGQAVASLTEAFLLAGAGAVVASLWPVPDDAAVPFIGDFYAGLVSGAPVGKALHEAKAKAQIADRSRFDVWANFQCFGNPDITITFDQPIRGQA